MIQELFDLNDKTVLVTGGGGDSIDGPLSRSAEPLLPLPQPVKATETRIAEATIPSASRAEHIMETLLVREVTAAAPGACRQQGQACKVGTSDACLGRIDDLVVQRASTPL